MGSSIKGYPSSGRIKDADTRHTVNALIQIIKKLEIEIDKLKSQNRSQ
jgi:hypothetical protein